MDGQERATAGGFDWWADFLGFAVAAFFTLVLVGIVSAVIGAVGYNLGAGVPRSASSISSTSMQLGIGAVVGTLIAVFLAYVVGGYTAARLARFDGVRNGLGVLIWTIIVAIVIAALGLILGSNFNVAPHLPFAVDRTTLTAGGAISSLVALLVMAGGAALGGWLGERHYRQFVPVSAVLAARRGEPVPETTEEMTRVRDLGDVVEIPVVEEELVKRPVVKEVIRVRKTSVPQERLVEDVVRREDVEVEREDVTGRSEAE